MSELARHSSQRAALRADAHRGVPTRYNEAVNRYLGAVSYRPGQAHRAAGKATVVGPTGGPVVVGVPGSLGSVSRAMVPRAYCPVFVVG